ncbi:MAG: hypothetical protein Q9M94_05430, partial [Candidatus Gracilibacteria bacterium]|nr:hypothetical protein [Candidatus Gracilibacteria bacterium]
IKEGEDFIFDNGGEGIKIGNNILFLNEKGDFLGISDKKNNELIINNENMFKTAQIYSQKENGKKISKRGYNILDFNKTLKEDKEIKVIIDSYDIEENDTNEKKSFFEEQQIMDLERVSKTYPEEIRSWFKPIACTSYIGSGKNKDDIKLYGITKEDYALFENDFENNYNIWNKFKEKFLIEQNRLIETDITTDKWKKQKSNCDILLNECFNEMKNEYLKNTIIGWSLKGLIEKENGETEKFSDKIFIKDLVEAKKNIKNKYLDRGKAYIQLGTSITKEEEEENINENKNTNIEEAILYLSEIDNQRMSISGINCTKLLVENIKKNNIEGIKENLLDLDFEKDRLSLDGIKYYNILSEFYLSTEEINQLEKSFKQDEYGKITKNKGIKNEIINKNISNEEIIKEFKDKSEEEKQEYYNKGIDIA